MNIRKTLTTLPIVRKLGGLLSRVRAMPVIPPFLFSLTYKNLAVFLMVFLVAMSPMVYSYWNDVRENRIDILSGRLELIAMHSIRKLDLVDISAVKSRSMTNSAPHQRLIAILASIQREFRVDNAVLMRRGANGQFFYIADGYGQFAIGQPVALHKAFPETFKAATEAWKKGTPIRTGLFGITDTDYLQVYTPIQSRGSVVAQLLINKRAEEVDQLIKREIQTLVLLSALLAVLGAVGFWFFSNRMLAPLRHLKDAALRLAEGDLEVQVPAISRRDEVSDLNESFRMMVKDLRRHQSELEQSNQELKGTISRIQMMEDLERNLSKFVPREVSIALQKDPDALERGKIQKDVTVLFLDIEGSSRLTETLGPQSIDRLIEVYFSRYLDPIYENHGDITETAGDGLMIIFQEDENHHHAQNAVKAAVTIQEITQRIQEKLAPGEERVIINIGINTGSALVGFSKFEAVSGSRFTFTASGRTTIVAARLADLAHNGTILIGYETMKRISLPGDSEIANHKLVFFGLKELKNIVDPERVYTLERD